MQTLREELEELFKRRAIGSNSMTPDTALAEYLISCIKAFEVATARRDMWRESE